MNTRVHLDENAPRGERHRVLRAADGQEHGGRWVTVESFGTRREAHAFARGFTLGSAYGRQEAAKAGPALSDHGKFLQRWHSGQTGWPR